jgi:hypothetical protein
LKNPKECNFRTAFTIFLSMHTHPCTLARSLLRDALERSSLSVRHATRGRERERERERERDSCRNVDGLRITLRVFEALLGFLFLVQES